MKKIIQLFVFLIASLLYSQATEYEIFNSSINSKYAEFGVTYTNNNKVLFASSKKNEKDISFIKGRRLNNRQLYLELYSGFVNERGDITETEKFTNETNNKYFESDITFSSDLKTVYFTWNNFYNTHKRIDSAKWQTLRIVKASFNKNFKLINTTSLPFNSSEYSVRNPELSKDGKQLYFISDMPNGFGDTDIYVVDIHSDGTYGKPKNLGPNINTKKSEIFPFIDENNTLYFSSYGHKGKGRLDIFKSEFKDGKFQKAINLPKPINSKFDDFAYVINNLTNSGFITSNRIGGKGGTDIYAFKILEKIITVVNEDIDNSIQISNNDLKESPEIFKTDSSTSINCTQLITGVILDGATMVPLSNAIVKIFKNNQFTDTLKITSNALFEYEIECNTKYRFETSHNDYRNTSIFLYSSNIPNEIYNKKILLKSSLDFISVLGKRMIKTNTIYFELDKSDINNDSAIELNKVVEILKKYPTIRIEIESHTDSRAPDNYNMILSIDRAKTIKDYIISKGIDSIRVSGRGFGETKLLNKCSNGVKCSDSEHRLNRRTEFILIDN